MRDTIYTHIMSSVGVFAVGMEIYRHADNLLWLVLWVLAAFWIGYAIAKEPK